jgi:hypothetical protein
MARRITAAKACRADLAWVPVVRVSAEPAGTNPWTQLVAASKAVRR